jgi:hypothetical protein
VIKLDLTLSFDARRNSSRFVVSDTEADRAKR